MYNLTAYLTRKITVGINGIVVIKKFGFRSKAQENRRFGIKKSSLAVLGPGCREFESRHSDQINRTGYMPFLLISFGGARLERLNATRMSVAAEGWTEANLNFHLW